MQQIRQRYSRITGHIVWMGVGLGLFVWVLDALFDSVVLNQGSFIGRLIPVAYPEEISDRVQILALLIIVSVHVQVIVRGRQQLASTNEALQAEIADRRRAEEALRQSEERFRALVQNVTDVILLIDANGTIRYLSPSCERVLGYTSEERIGGNVFSMVPPEELPRAQRLFAEVLATPGATRTMELRVRHRDGSWRHIEATGSNLLDDPSVGGIVVTYRDRTARQRAEDALRFLAQASRALAASLDYEATLTDLARLAVPILGDWCSIDVIEEQGQARRVATAHVDPAKAALVEELRRYPPDLDSPDPVSRALATGEPVCTSGVCDPAFLAGAGNAGHLDLLRRLGLRSCLVVPLAAHGRVLGAITFAVADGPRRYDQADLALAEELARLAALVVAKAQLYQAERRARQVVERAAERATQLQAVSVALSEVFTSDQVARVLVAQSMSALGATAGMVALLTGPRVDGAELELLHSVGYPPEVVEAQRRIPLTPPTPIADAVRKGEPVLLASRTTRSSHSPQSASAEPSAGDGAVAALPLGVEGRTVGGLSLHFGAAREFSADDRALLLSLARLGAQALERA
ncbi:MAG: GAF domain-containing protein, partial [Actinomycetota bacterium]|nr:GAF domain-containing protein [Actinomycetota bacterium]